MALGIAFLPHTTTDHNRLLVQRRHCFTFADKGPKLCHFRDDHRHHFKRINLIVGKAA